MAPAISPAQNMRDDPTLKMTATHHRTPLSRRRTKLPGPGDKLKKKNGWAKLRRTLAHYEGRGRRRGVVGGAGL